MTDLADLTAVDLLSQYRSGALSPVEVTEAVLARIDRLEPEIAALYLPRPDEARAAARDSEARWRRGEARALEGVPTTIKENVATKGDPMPLGTAARPLVPMPEDAPASARLREAGTVILGKTTMPDYGMLSSGLSSFHHLSRNPWDTSKGPGGSSAGAGAAAAAGYGPLHVGTDIGGSVRLPATWCGVFGLKPSFGRVPVDPPFWGRVIGPLTRTVADGALMMREMAKPDRRDGMSLPPLDTSWELKPRSLKGLKIGLQLDAGIGIPTDPEVRATIEAAGRLFEQAGAHVAPLEPFLGRSVLAGLDVFWRVRAWADIGPLPEAERAKVLPYILRWAEGGRERSGDEVYRGVSQMAAMRDATLKATAPFDYVLSPVGPCTAFPAEFASPGDDPEHPFEHICFTVPYNFSEQPAASVNAGYSSAGLPIGLQIAGPRFDDLGVMEVAQAFEEMRGPQKPWPLN